MISDHGLRLFFLCLVLGGATSALAADAPAMPGRKKVLVLPVSFPMAQMAANGVTEPVRDWTQAAATHLTSALQAQIVANASFELVAAPQLSESELAGVREHVALCSVIADSASYVLDDGGRAWKDKLDSFDYSVGKGLAYLEERTGADHAFCLTGTKTQTSDGRKALAIFGAVGGVGMTMGDARAALALVELATGNIVWMESMNSVLDDVRTERGGADVARKLVSDYPGSRLLQR